MPSIYTEICHCGHDKSSHYLDHDAVPPERITCLCTGCECKRYVHEGEPKPRESSARPEHVPWCRCYRCKQFL